MSSVGDRTSCLCSVSPVPSHPPRSTSIHLHPPPWVPMQGDAVFFPPLDYPPSQPVLGMCNSTRATRWPLLASRSGPNSRCWPSCLAACRPSGNVLLCPVSMLSHPVFGLSTFRHPSDKRMPILPICHPKLLPFRGTLVSTCCLPILRSDLVQGKTPKLQAHKPLPSKINVSASSLLAFPHGFFPGPGVLPPRFLTALPFRPTHQPSEY